MKDQKESKVTRCPLTIPKELDEQFRALAERKGLSVTSWLRDIVQTLDGLKPEQENRLKAEIESFIRAESDSLEQVTNARRKHD